MVTAGDGQLQLLRYEYPDTRSMLDPDDRIARGVAGGVQQVQWLQHVGRGASPCA